MSSPCFLSKKKRIRYNCTSYSFPTSKSVESFVSASFESRRRFIAVVRGRNLFGLVLRLLVYNLLIFFKIDCRTILAAASYFPIFPRLERNCTDRQNAKPTAKTSDGINSISLGDLVQTTVDRDWGEPVKTAQNFSLLPMQMIEEIIQEIFEKTRREKTLRAYNWIMETLFEQQI